MWLPHSHVGWERRGKSEMKARVTVGSTGCVPSSPTPHFLLCKITKTDTSKRHKGYERASFRRPVVSTALQENYENSKRELGGVGPAGLPMGVC